MCKISNWKLAQKLQTSNKKNLVLCVTVVAIVILFIVGLLMKMCWLKCWLKRKDYLHYDLDDLGCDCDDIDCDCDDDCSFTSEKDFV